VNERSACIDGHYKLGLPTDHLKINKYYGPDDPSFKYVYPRICEMAKTAVEVVQCRLSPRTIVEDDSKTKGKLREFQKALYLTNPPYDLAEIRQFRKRAEGTCEWILVQEEYIAWVVQDTSQLLQLVGNPGIGKTVISTFLVETLEERICKTINSTFAYYFCDNKDEKRNTATAILRGLILQLLRQ